MDGKKIIELKQERATLVTSIRALMDEFEGKEMPQDKKDELGRMEARFDTLNGSITKEEKQLERERIIGEAQDKLERKKDKVDEVSMAFNDYLKFGSQSTFEAYAALQQDNPTQAGYLVAPEKFVMELIKELDNTFFFRGIAKVLPPLKGAQSLGYPKRTSRMSRATRGTELQTPTPDTALAFGKREFKPAPATAEILLSRTLMRNAPEVDGIVRAEMNYAFGEMLEIEYMTGSGAGGQCLGVFIASNDGISTTRDISAGNTATEIKFDGLFEAKYAIKEQYQPRLQWIFHRDGVKQIAKLKDNDGQYIWQPSVVADQPDRLLGKPVHMSEYAPNTFITGQYVGIIGDFSYYWIADSLAMEIQVLTELYARSNQIDYIGRLETDGMPVLEECFARVKLG
ncbi:MAG: Phage capsid family protein [Pelotomaculum sp. PtaB.Bin104]|nr:MAG: Phage capsid family protein [Pelotomaculum sp. PtaB.Bin104]